MVVAALALFTPDGNSAPPANASHLTYTIEQGNVQIGAAVPLDGGLVSVQTMYDYGPVTTSTGQTALTTSGTSSLFLYKHEIVPVPATNGNIPVISLVIIHDKANDGSGGKANFGFTGLPAAADWVVRDDPTIIDTYTPWTPPTGSASWAWAACCTDGGAIQGGLHDEFCITVSPLLFEGITQWDFLTGGDVNLHGVFILDIQKPVTISTPLGVCPPASVGGIVELPGQSESPGDASGSSARDYTVPIAAAIAAGAVVLAAAGWHAKRRWMR